VAKVAVIQVEVSDGEEPESRLERVEEVVLSLGRESPDLVVMPELWVTGYLSFDRYEGDAEPIDGVLPRRFAAWAQRLGSYVIPGSFVERAGGSLYNSAPLFDRSGELVAVYRKIHLFAHGSRERDLLAPGRATVVASSPVGGLGVSICYDLRFPELYRPAAEEGAATFCVAAAWPSSRIEHWRLLTRARAVENQSYVIGANCCGGAGGSAFGGRSVVVDPSGDVVAEAPAGGEDVLLAEVDPSAVLDLRARFPVLDEALLPSPSPFWEAAGPREGRDA